MVKLIMTRGLPGSGKTTWAKEQVRNSGGRTKCVNKDDLRGMIDAGVWSHKRESVILEIQWGLAKDFLITGCDVIIDNTNLHPKHYDKANEIITELLDNGIKCTLEVNDSFLQVPLEECIRRDSLRPNPVGKNIILQMWNQYLKSEPPVHNPKLPECIIVDIDGTLALFGNNNPYNRDFSLDTVSQQVLSVVSNFWHNGCNVIILSGRSDKNKEVTQEWLNANHIMYDELHMRKDGDVRSDDIIKLEIYNEFIKDKYNVYFVIDDRPKVIRMWRSLGLFVFDVNQGGYEF